MLRAGVEPATFLINCAVRKKQTLNFFTDNAAESVMREFDSHIDFFAFSDLRK